MKRQKVELTITVELTDYELDNEEKEWYEKDILIAGDDLILHSNEVGDSLGNAIKVANVRWINES
ncbi:MAG: hypothetical protein HRT87_12070 [Legionellales bacterium]|nr:hypothetical protein [Legionellales bacterium]